MEFTDEPKCVTADLRALKISLNDRGWSSMRARAKGLHDLGLAQVGSRGVITNKQFNKAFLEEAKVKLIPMLIKRDRAASASEFRDADDVLRALPRDTYPHNLYLRTAANVALAALEKLKAPGLKLLAQSRKLHSK